MDREALRQQALDAIEDAFSNVELGDGITLVDARIMDTYVLGSELTNAAKESIEQQVANAFRGRWQDIPFATLQQYQDTMPYMDARGRLFHLPAFLRAMLSTGGDSIEFPLYYLQAVDRHKSEFAAMTDAQRRSVALFLAWQRLTDWDFFQRHLDEAFRNYWSQFLPPDSANHPGAPIE